MNHQPQGVFISDCEGPISKNDNAFELTKHFIPGGSHFFALISKYDDVLADVIRRPQYRAGYTLKLITPFLKAYGATNKAIEKYSAENIRLIKGARTMLNYLKTLVPSFIISTSYNQYISSLCSVIDFPYENAYCTNLDLDKHTISKEEEQQLRCLREEITSYSMIEIPEEATALEHLSHTDQKTETGGGYNLPRPLDSRSGERTGYLGSHLLPLASGVRRDPDRPGKATEDT